MGRAYQSKFKKIYEVFHGVIDSSKWSGQVKKEFKPPFKIAFAGSIEHSQMLGIADIATAIDSLNAAGSSIRFILYITAQYEERWAEEFKKYGCIEICRHPSYSQLSAAFGGVDLLVLAYGFDDHTIEYYRYSFATKIVPYMLSGTCILAYGPPEIEPIDYAKRGGWAIVQDERDLNALAQKIFNFTINQNEFSCLAEKAFAVAQNDHDLYRNAERFRSSLITLKVSNN
jgi:hypothetical protein